MTQSEEIPAEPLSGLHGEPTEPFGGSTGPAETSGEPTLMWTQPVDPTPFPAQAQGEYGFAVPVVPALSPEEQAAAAAKKAKRRMLFAKSTALAVPAVVLVALLVGTSIEAGALSTKITAASTAAKSATAAGGLVAPLHAAQAAAEASILVDAGCLATESQATASLETKLTTDANNLGTAEQGTSLSAFTAASNKYINDLQTFSTDLQQDAALTSRASLKTAIGALTSDFSVAISAMQDALSGNFSTKTENSLDAAATRMDGDATAVDTMCGGDTLNGGGSGFSSSPSSSSPSSGGSSA
jgi:hypothetical protein